MTRDQLTADIITAQASADDTRDSVRQLVAHLDRMQGERVSILAERARIDEALASLTRQVMELAAERERVAETLAAFYAAPLSLSSVQPLLDLAVRLNPALAPRQTIAEKIPESIQPEPVKVIDGENCGNRQDYSGYWCSRIKGHAGSHRAYYNHDSATPLLAEWPCATVRL